MLIPHYHTNSLKLLDKEDEHEVVRDNLECFRRMYHPIWQQTFGDCFSLANGQFEVQHDAKTRKFLMRHINDNIWQNIERTISVSHYDQELKFHKVVMKEAKKLEIIEEINKDSNVETQNTALKKSIDKILIAHRNTKFFLFLMSWQCFALYYVTKKIL